jgi:hypothetical protein
MEQLINGSSSVTSFVVLFLLASFGAFIVYAFVRLRSKSGVADPTQEDVIRAIMNLLILDCHGLSHYLLAERLPGLVGRRVKERYFLSCLSQLVAEELVHLDFDNRYSLTQQGKYKLRRDTAREAQRLENPGSRSNMLN